VVTSSLAIHNVPDAAGRDAAIDEIVRVLRPGGCALVVDFRHAAEYAARMRERGLAVTRRGLGWRMWFGGPQARGVLVVAMKPAR
jgi:ubiquinone/menaquinone biosynthesis C-methylase UbiE